MATYLEEHPPARRQGRPRARRASGAVGWHTAESIKDDVGPDTGAENLAAYIARRTEPGSYHAIPDSDSIVTLWPDDFAAYSIAVTGLNDLTYNVGAACRTTDLVPGDPWTLATMANMAKATVDYWRRQGIEPRDAARWLTRAEVLAEEVGLFHHGTVQPGDRTDAFAASPHRAELEAFAIELVLAYAYPEETGAMMLTPEQLENVVQAAADRAAAQAAAGTLEVAVNALDKATATIADEATGIRRHSRTMTLSGKAHSRVMALSVKATVEAVGAAVVTAIVEAIGRLELDATVDADLIAQTVTDAIADAGLTPEGIAAELARRGIDFDADPEPIDDEDG